MYGLFILLIVKPIFNLLVLITAILPGHNFGLAIILFTIVIYTLMWPLVKKQLHQTKRMRELQPLLKKIKQDTKGDRQKESKMVMELYKEQGVSPFGTIGTLIVRFIILIGLYLGLQRIIKDPREIVNFSYDWLNNLPWLKEVAADIGRFDETLLGFIDLTQAAIGPEGFYLPAMLLVLGSAFAQYKQTVQLLPKMEDGRGLRQILKQAGSGQSADAMEVNAATGRLMSILLPFIVVIFTVQLASALSLYWLVGGLISYLQQARILGQDQTELVAMADASVKPAKAKVISKASKTTKASVASTPTASSASAVEGEVLPPPNTHKSKRNKKSSKKSKRGRR